MLSYGGTDIQYQSTSSVYCVHWAGPFVWFFLAHQTNSLVEQEKVKRKGIYHKSDAMRTRKYSTRTSRDMSTYNASSILSLLIDNQYAAKYYR